MLFLDQTYFWGILRLPRLNVDGAAAGVPGRLATTTQEALLEEYIALYEPEFLTLLLGGELYAAMLQGLEAGDPDGIWEALKGQIFWTGNGKPVSPAANYVYCKVKTLNKTADVVKGNVKPEVSHARVSNDNARIVEAWNRMDGMARAFYAWLAGHEEYEPYAGKCFKPHCFGLMNDFYI